MRPEAPAAQRLSGTGEDVGRSLGRLVVTLLEVVRQVVERQALRRVECGDLAPADIERLGRALMDLETTFDELTEHFGVVPQDLYLPLDLDAPAPTGTDARPPSPSETRRTRSTMSTASRAPRPSSLADVLEVVLDKGIVIDAYVRVSLVGIELLTIDARIVIASVDTYLRFAEAVNRLDLQPSEQVAGLPGLMDNMREGGARTKTKGALEGAKESVKDTFSSLTGRDKDEDDEDDDEREEEPARRSDRSAPASRRPRRRG